MPRNLDHSIRLHFPYTFDSNASTNDYRLFSDQIAKISLKDLINSASFLSPNIDDSQLNSKLWQLQETELDNRIHPFANKLVNGIKENAISEGFFGMQPIRLSDDGISLLNRGSAQNPGKGISLLAEAAALKRLADRDLSPPLNGLYWPMMFNSVWFYGLNTGIGILVIDLSFRQPEPNGISIKWIEELQEINYVICRNSDDTRSPVIDWGEIENNPSSPENSNNQSTSTKTQGLSGLVDGLIPLATGKTIQLKATDDRKNTYAYSFLATHQGLDREQRKKFIFRLARKYHELYLPEKIEEQIDYFEPFKPITHAFCLEGAATYVDFICCGENIPESIRNFNVSAIPNAYAPLVMLTYSEYIFLREMATNTPDNEKVDMRNPTNENLAKLREFRTKLYDFRLNFRYSQISGNTNHNLFCNANKKALEIKELLAETSSDTQEIEQYIADHVGQKQAARLKRFGVLGSLFAVIIGWVDLWGLNLHNIIFEESQNNPTSIAIFFGVLILLAAVVLIASKNPSNKNASKRPEK